MSAPTASPTPASPTPPAPARRPGTGPVGVFGWIFAVIGLLLALGAIACLVVNFAVRGSDGYFTTGSERFGSPGFAVTADGLDLTDLAGKGAIEDVLGHVRVTAERPGGAPVFVGIAPTTDVDRYLGGVGRSEVTDVDGSDISYQQHAGGPPAGSPIRQGFWDTRAVGTGAQTATWKVHSGDWSIVVMNATGSRPVQADVKVGAKTSLLLWGALGLFALALIFGGGGAVMITQDPRRKPQAS